MNSNKQHSNSKSNRLYMRQCEIRQHKKSDFELRLLFLPTKWILEKHQIKEKCSNRTVCLKYCSSCTNSWDKQTAGPWNMRESSVCLRAKTRGEICGRFQLPLKSPHRDKLKALGKDTKEKTQITFSDSTTLQNSASTSASDSRGITVLTGRTIARGSRQG